MQDEELVLLNTCSDLVSLRKFEACPLQLLRGQPGEWVGVRDLCLQIGVSADNLKPDLFATWLADPMGHDGYAVVLFYDDESKWTMAAHYNRQRLLGSGSPDAALQPAGAAPVAK
jgi:hypothetical protein